MIKYEDECVGCATETYPCLGKACKNRNVRYLYCDLCGDEVEKLYVINGEELCIDCVAERLEVIE